MGAAPRLGAAAGRTTLLAVGLGGLLVIVGASLFVGAGEVTAADVWSQLAHRDGSRAATIVWEMRVPRTLVAVIVGLALGMAGAIMQTFTRNPLADPGLLGVNAGAGLAVVIAAGAFGMTRFEQYVWPALGGAFVVTMVVYVIGSASGPVSPGSLVLAGTAVTAVLTGIATGLALVDPRRFNATRGWLAGSVAGRDLRTAGLLCGFVLGGVVIASLTARPLSQLALGEDVARSLGVRVGRTRAAAAAAILLLAGAGTAAAGPVVFIGLMVPHAARALVGHAPGWVLAYSALAGAGLLVLADIAARLVVWPAEAPAGLVTAIVGAPVLALVARRET